MASPSQPECRLSPAFIQFQAAFRSKISLSKKWTLSQIYRRIIGTIFNFFDPYFIAESDAWSRRWQTGGVAVATGASPFPRFRPLFGIISINSQFMKNELCNRRTREHLWRFLGASLNKSYQICKAEQRIFETGSHQLPQNAYNIHSYQIFSDIYTFLFSSRIFNIPKN